MQARCRLNNVAHLADLQAKGGVLELLLHVSLAEEAAMRCVVSLYHPRGKRRNVQISSLPSTTAVRLGHGQISECI